LSMRAHERKGGQRPGRSDLKEQNNSKTERGGEIKESAFIRRVLYGRGGYLPLDEGWGEGRKKVLQLHLGRRGKAERKGETRQRTEEKERGR